MNNLTRRSFLRTSAAAAAAPLILRAPLCGQHAPSNRLNIAVIGLGNQSRIHLKNLQGPGENIIALCDVDERQIATAKKENKALAGAKTYRDYRQMLDREKTLDAVVVATPDHWHTPLCKALMRAGKHVYCEKPLTHSVGEARELRQLLKTCKVVTQMGNQGSASASLRRSLELIQAGVLGQIREVHASVRDGRNLRRGTVRPAGADPVPAGFNWDFWCGPAPLRPYKEETYHPKIWRGWYDFGCGHLGDFGCHAFNLPVRALKLGYPEKITVSAQGLGTESYITSGTIELHFAARPNLAPVKLVWYDGEVPVAPALFQEVIALRQGNFPGGVVLIGEKGKLFTNSWNGEAMLMLNGEVRPKDVLFHEPTKGIAASVPRTPSHHEEWIAACKGGPATYSDFEVGGQLTEIVLAGLVALRVGHSIDWDGEKMEVRGEPDAKKFIHPAPRPTWLL